MKTVRMETSSLILREAVPEDAMTIPAGKTEAEETLEKITGMMENHRRNSPGRLFHLCLGLFLKSSGEFVGWCGLDNRVSTGANPVLFYVIEEPHRGMGYATQAAKAMLRYGFQELGLPVIDAGVAVDNPASIRVLEKIRMKRTEGTEEGFLMFSMNRNGFSEG